VAPPFDHQRFSAIAHADLAICNPLSDAALDEAIGQLELLPGARILDLGCGKATALARTVERYQARGVGVDISPLMLAEARVTAMRVGRGELELVEADATTFRSDAPFDAVLCLGPGWAHDSFAGLVGTLIPHLAERGLLLIGEGYWRSEPTETYLALLGATRDELETHEGNIRVAMDAGLIPLWASTASVHDWDRYEWRYLATVERWAASHGEDPNAEAFLARARHGRDRYLAGGRDQLGFGCYLFRSP
jgi:SAM-dependent methyltransferase